MQAEISWQFLGEVKYRAALAHQKSLERQLLTGERDGFLLLLTHPPTFTVGRRDSSLYLRHSEERLSELGFDFSRTDRGGLVTYHGPGQLVGYPILHLGRLGIKGVQDYIFLLEGLLIELCRELGVEGRRTPGQRGVFIGKNKIGAVGVHVARQLTTHGFSFNVNPDLEHYRLITACGLEDHGVSSLARLGIVLSLEEVARTAAEIFGRIFSVHLRESNILKETPISAPGNAD